METSADIKNYIHVYDPAISDEIIKCMALFQVNELQAKIKETTRKMMALVSELSMNQANALKLQQNLKEKEADLEQCYIRMEKGEPPSDEIEGEWLKVLRDDDRRSRDKEEIRMVCQLPLFL